MNANESPTGENDKDEIWYGWIPKLSHEMTINYNDGDYKFFDDVCKDDLEEKFKKEYLLLSDNITDRFLNYIDISFNLSERYKYLRFFNRRHEICYSNHAIITECQYCKDKIWSVTVEIKGENETLIKGTANIHKNGLVRYEIKVNEVKGLYLFCWNDVPKSNKKFIKFLKDDLKIKWANNAKIEKIDDGKIISVTNENNSLLLKLDKTKKKVSLEGSDKIYKLQDVRMMGINSLIFTVKRKLKCISPELKEEGRKIKIYRDSMNKAQDIHILVRNHIHFHLHHSNDMPLFPVKPDKPDDEDLAKREILRAFLKKFIEYKRGIGKVDLEHTEKDILRAMGEIVYANSALNKFYSISKKEKNKESENRYEEFKISFENFNESFKVLLQGVSNRRNRISQYLMAWLSSSIMIFAVINISDKLIGVLPNLPFIQFLQSYLSSEDSIKLLVLLWFFSTLYFFAKINKLRWAQK